MNAIHPVPSDIRGRVGTRAAIGIRQGSDARFVVWKCDCGSSGSMRLSAWQRGDSLHCDRCSKPKFRLRLAAADREQAPRGKRSDEFFRCAALRLTLRRASCADQYRNFNKHIQRSEGRTGCACSDCPIGKKHATGKSHPSAPAIVIIARPSDKKRKLRTCHCGGALPPGRHSTCSPACGSQRKAFDALAHAIEMREAYR